MAIMAMCDIFLNPQSAAAADLLAKVDTTLNYITANFGLTKVDLGQMSVLWPELLLLF